MKIIITRFYRFTIYCPEKLPESPSPQLAATLWEEEIEEDEEEQLEQDQELQNADKITHQYLHPNNYIEALEPDEFIDVGVHDNPSGSANNNVIVVGQDKKEEDEKWEETFETVKQNLLDENQQRKEARRQSNIESKRRRLAEETEFDRQQRRQREAEAKRRRRQNETPEQRQRRLALHAERMRKVRRMNKNESEQRPTIVRQYLNNTYTTYTQPEPDLETTQVTYQTNDRLQFVTVPQHQQYQQQQVRHGYGQNPNQPTVITVPIPTQQQGNGPVTIHVTLPENVQAGQQIMVSSLFSWFWHFVFSRTHKIFAKMKQNAKNNFYFVFRQKIKKRTK